jgi:hypothetical protein
MLDWSFREDAGGEGYYFRLGLRLGRLHGHNFS